MNQIIKKRFEIDAIQSDNIYDKMEKRFEDTPHLVASIAGNYTEEPTLDFYVNIYHIGDATIISEFNDYIDFFGTKEAISRAVSVIENSLEAKLEEVAR